MSVTKPNIVIASPLQIVGAFLVIIREHYLPHKNKPWAWDPDMAVGTDLTKKPIQIESMFAKNTEVRNFRPSIFVGRDTIPLQDTIIGDTVDVHNPTGRRVNFNIVHSSIRIVVEAEHLGEAEIIAYDVARHIHYAKDMLVRLVANWKHVGPVQLLPPTVSMKDSRYSVIPISVGLQYELLWEVTPIAPKIQEILFRLDDVEDPHNQPQVLKLLLDRYDTTDS